ncbi:MAG: hypothetical protein A2040_10045 [Rhodocyclales bacterium GWA2_65_19]|nr:MAG: hypothetical protein A2040_10045 [Rhodocyclales bacterium GWA2_65_19]
MPKTKAARAAPATSERLSLTIEELAQRTGFSVRNIRAYQTSRMLPKPKLRGRLGLYDEHHIARLELIRDMRGHGFGLEAIGQILNRAGDVSWQEISLMTRSLTQGFFTVEEPVVRPLSSLGAKWGRQATAQLRSRARKVGLYRDLPKEPGQPEEIEILSPSLDRIGEQLALLGIPMSTVLDLEESLVKHSRAIARVYVNLLFLRLWRAHGGSGGKGGSHPSRELKTIFEQLRPLAISSLSAAFPVILQQEFDIAFKRAVKRAR